MQIFICYSRVDKAFAARLVEDLSDFDIKIWMDVRNIPHGANWDLEVQKGLDASDVMLVLLSPSSVESQNVADEWSYFIDKNKLILPVMIAPCEPPFRLSRRQRVDLTLDYKLGFQQLIKALGSPVLLDPESTQRIRAVSVPPKPETKEEAPAKEGPKAQPARVSRPANDSSGLNSAVKVPPKPGSKSVSPEVSTHLIPIIWANSYHWFNGMSNGGTSGDIMISSREVSLIPHSKPIIVLPLQSLVSARLKRSVDQYIQLTFYSPDGSFRSLVLMGADKKQRASQNQEIRNLLKLVTGKSLD